MTRTPLLFALVLSLALTGCAAHRTSAGAARRIPDYYASAAGFSARVRAAVDRGTSENTFTLLWKQDGQGTSIEVVSPSSVAGLRAEIAPDSRTLVYDGAVLTLPEAVSPLELLPVLGLAWESPWSEYETAKDTVTLISYETVAGEPCELRTRFDAVTLLPLEAAVFLDGRRVVLYSFELFSFS